MARFNSIENERLLTDVLKSVSRSFYLSIRILPPAMRQPVAVAYLLARTADTISDTQALPPSRRLEQLLAFRAQIAQIAQIEGNASHEAVPCMVAGLDADSAIACMMAGLDADSEGASPGERTLLQNAGRVLLLLEELLEEDRERVQRVVVTLTLGMELDLTTFPAEGSGSVGALTTPAQLDRYTYLVAGCVGEFWTKTAMAHVPRMADRDAGDMSALGVRFGKALQLTNVLRDVPKDLRNGRCYLPAEDLEAAGLEPGDLLKPGYASRARHVLAPWIRTALEHYEAAETYLLQTPRRCLRLRLAAVWPILLGLATLEKLALNDCWLDPARPSRVRRRWVYWMMARSLVAAQSDVLLRTWIRGLRRKVERALRGV